MTFGLYSLNDLSGFHVTLADGRRALLDSVWFREPDERECHITHLDVLMRDATGPSGHALVPTGRILRVDATGHAIQIDMTARELGRAGIGRDAPTRQEPAFRTTDFVGATLTSRDRESGTLIDFLIDTLHWDVRYFNVDLGPREVLIDPAWTNDIDGRSGRIAVDLPHDAIAQAPEFIGAELVNPGYCEALYRHYTSREYAH